MPPRSQSPDRAPHFRPRTRFLVALGRVASAGGGISEIEESASFPMRHARSGRVILSLVRLRCEPMKTATWPGEEFDIWHGGYQCIAEEGEAATA